MKTVKSNWKGLWIAVLALAAAWPLSQAQAGARVARAVVLSPVALKHSSDGAESNENKIVIEAVEPEGQPGKGKAAAWLGVVAEECSEALASQLGLSAGEGLLVTFVAPDSPAAKAGLQKNDVLAEFEGQVLVHPAQLRKLIRMHKAGDTVKLTLYRAGKKQTLEATVGQSAASLPGEGSEDFRAWQRQLKDLPIEEAVREQMKNLRESLAQAGIDKNTLSQEIKRSIEDVRKAIQEALRQATNAAHTFGPAAREFQELARRGFDVDKDATVVVKSKQDSVKSIVKTDESGSYVVVATPKKQLTAHDKSGRLLFDGPIETADEQAKVPQDVWAKVKPMLEQLNQDDRPSEKPEADSNGK